MALINRFDSQEHHVEYEKAYHCILEGCFSNNRVDVIVATFTSPKAREKRQEFDGLHRALEEAQTKTFEANTRREECARNERDANAQLQEAQGKIESGEIQEDQLNEKRGWLEEARKQYLEQDGELTALIEEESKLRLQLEKLPMVNPIKVDKYSFPVSEDELASRPIFEIAYDRLKHVPAFEGAEDA